MKEVKQVANEIIQRREDIRKEYLKCIENGVPSVYLTPLSSTTIKKLPIELKHRYK